ncbi:MAG: right-handed parallel beta-helix repeat-containing protein [Saprospiraceae bacterium]|nr:right-handed parallel beta-helix repeat-containing protein [Saprospiraceae bacterium]
MKIVSYISSLILLLTVSNVLQAKIIYVDGNSGSNHWTYDQNSDWAHAWKDLTHALYWARTNDDIYINAGTYVPVQAGVYYADPRSQSFYAHSNVRLFGGFSVENSAFSFGDRNPALYVTTLSGDIQRDGIGSNNSYSILRTYLGNGFSKLDGLTISGAYPGDFASYGGGIFLNNVAPEINNCIITGNTATQGSGIYLENSNASITNSTISYNQAVGGSGFLTFIAGIGAGMFNEGSSPSVTNCNFNHNAAIYGANGHEGGFAWAVMNNFKYVNSSPIFTNCSFTENNANSPTLPTTILNKGGSAKYIGCTIQNNAGRGITSLNSATDEYRACIITGNTATSGNDGGAFFIDNAGPSIYNCLIAGNLAGRYGGGIALNFTKTNVPYISNCQITSNVSLRGGGIYSFHSAPQVSGCTISGNNASGGRGGGVYTEGRGNNGGVSTPISVGPPVSYSNTIIFGNQGGGFWTDSLQANFYTAPLEISKYLPPAIFYTDTDYNERPNANNCIFGQTRTDSLYTRFAKDLGGNKININPNFENAAIGNYRLNVCSPAVNAGSNGSVNASNPISGQDMAALQRIYEGNIDIGAYELQQPFGGTYSHNTVYVCAGQSAVIFGVARTELTIYSQTIILPNGCSAINEITLANYPSPSASASYFDNCGTTGTIKLSPEVGTAPFTIVLDGTTMSGVLANSSATFSGKTAGTYTYTITDANGCSSTGTAVLTTYNITQHVLFVDAAATNGTQDGLSWANAFTTLQAALDAANCSVFTEIWVSEGTYVPTSNPSGVADFSPYATFRMRNNLAIFGGFSSAANKLIFQNRDPNLYPAILSGDFQRDGVLENNAFNVVNNYDTGLNNTAYLDGFTIRDAYNNITGVGGGMINNGSSPRIENCTFVNNWASNGTIGKGGAMYNGAGSNPLVINCKFFFNSTSGSSYAFGGAIANDISAPIIKRCTFDGNSVSSVVSPAGGAMYSAGGSNILIENSLFVNNSGSAIVSDNNTHNINACTFTKNSGTSGTPGGLFLLGPNNATYITNTNIYGNTNGSLVNINCTPTLFYCNIEGSGGQASWNAAYGINGGGNQDENPRFTADYKLGICSPSINSADGSSVASTIDLAGNTRKIGLMDKGCFESQMTPPSYGSVVFVNAQATGANNGTSWADAFTDLQSALDLTCHKISEIWISKGTYYPSKSPGNYLTNDVFATFQMSNNLVIYGGFSVADSHINFPQRSPELYTTILSGDIQKDGVKTNNVYNVINNYGTNLNNTAVLDGITVSDAYNTFPTGGSGITWGAGVINVGSSPKFVNCTFRDNTNASFSEAFGGVCTTKTVLQKSLIANSSTILLQVHLFHTVVA